MQKKRILTLITGSLVGLLALSHIAGAQSDVYYWFNSSSTTTITNVPDAISSTPFRLGWHDDHWLNDIRPTTSVSSYPQPDQNYSPPKREEREISNSFNKNYNGSDSSEPSSSAVSKPPEPTPEEKEFLILMAKARIIGETNRKALHELEEYSNTVIMKRQLLELDESQGKNVAEKKKKLTEDFRDWVKAFVAKWEE